MQITTADGSEKFEVLVEKVETADFKHITKKKFFFNWKTERKNKLYKLRLLGGETILGLVSLVHFVDEQRIEIKLLAVSKENRGRKKKYKGIAGNLIAFACREAVKIHGANACVSLQPKTELKVHYIRKYMMIDAGRQVFLEGENLFKLLRNYIE